MKKLRFVPFAVLMTVGALTACAGGNAGGADYDIKTGDTYELKINKSLDFSKVKVGLICLHDTSFDVIISATSITTCTSSKSANGH